MKATKKSTQRDCNATLAKREPSLLCNSQMNVSAGEQMRRLGNRWVFDCANRLITDENMERKRAFQQAAKAYHLLEQLGKGEVRFEYLKANGELRKARGTLCRGISSELDNYEFKNDKPDVERTEFGIIVYFDLDKEAFRSLHIKNLIISSGLR